MSSISGVSPSITTQTQATTQVNQTSGTSASNTLYLNLGLSDLSPDLTGLTKPKSPSNSSTLIAEILALSEDLQEKLKEAQIRGSASGASASLTLLLLQLDTLANLSQTVAGWQKKLEELAEQKKAAQGVVNTYGSAVDNARGTVSFYEGPEGLSKMYANAQSSAAGAESYYNQIKDNKNVSQSDKNAAYTDWQNKKGKVDNFYTRSNPDYASYLDAKGVVNAHGADVDNARGTIADIEITDKDSPKYRTARTTRRTRRRRTKLPSRTKPTS